MPLLERSKVTVWERHLFKERFTMEVLSLGLPFVKWYFEEHHLCAFLFMAEITEILLFSGMPLLERSKTTVWERHLFKKKKNTMEDSSLCLLYVKTYFEEQQLSAFFFIAQIIEIFLFSGMPLLERSKITVGAESHRSHFLKII